MYDCNEEIGTDMEGEAVFKISEFSRLSQVSMKTLRYYDQIGLLKPASIDPFNGYRYYTTEQLFRLNRILAYKDLGLTLEQIAQALDVQIPLAEVRGMLRLKQAEIHALIEQESTRLARIEARLHLIEREGETQTGHDVALKSIKALRVASLPTCANLSSSHLPFFFEELNRSLSRSGLSEPATLPHMVLWQDTGACRDDQDDTFDVEVACPLPEQVSADAHLTIRTLPALPLVASLMHECQPHGTCTALLDLGRWMEQNGYTISLSQPCREVYFAKGENQFYVTEAQIPVEKG
ncbi:MerR family transcriptional regulator [Ktedonobacter sp. SOSP1-52]|nr:MerR family transcriptional regulator [Ktedonobacter sp. SOSP1-52]